MDILIIFEWFQQNLNYGTITLLMAIESSFIPFPSEIVVPPAAYFASQSNSELNIYLVVFFATVGALIGACINYYIALWVGRPLIYKFANSRFGHICLINEEKVLKAENYFDKHGAISTFIGRLIPAVRQLISIPAGLARMNLLSFITYTTLGAALWNAILAALGFWLSTFIKEDELFNKVEYYNHYLTMAGYALGVVVVLFIVYHILIKKKTVSTNINN
ncbi:MAG: DedA family protein [Muribaculaceae bacterium]